MSVPLVSVIIAVYNGESFIAEAVESILRDELLALELVVVDDGSTDGTLPALLRFCDDRLTVIKNEHNRGVSFSFNRAIKRSSGKYIAFLGADDISLPHRLKTQYDFMEAHPDIDICGSWAEIFGEKSLVLRLPETDAEIKAFFLFENALVHSSVIMRRDFIMRHNLYYNENLPCAVDYDLWARALDLAKFHNIPQVLVRYRTHPAQMGEMRKKEQERIAKNIVKSLLEKGGIFPSSEQLDLHYAFGRGYIFPQSIEELETLLQWTDRLRNEKKIPEKYTLVSKEIDSRFNVIGHYHRLLGHADGVMKSFVHHVLFRPAVSWREKARFMARWVKKIFFKGTRIG